MSHVLHIDGDTILLHFETRKGTVSLNNSSKHEPLEKRAIIGPSVLQACEVLSSFPNNIPINQEVRSAMDLLFDAEVCFSPMLFLSREKRLHRGISDYFVNTSSFASSLLEALDAVGAFSFLQRLLPAQRDHAHGHLMRLMAPFAMSAAGLEEVEDAPLELIHAVVDLYRSPDGDGWNEQIFGSSDVSKQCARAVIAGLSEVYDDETLLAKAVAGPATGRGARSWKRLKGSTDPLIKEMFLRFERFLETSRTRPDKLKQTFMDLSNWLVDSYPHMSLIQILQKKDRRRSFPDFLASRSGSIKRYHVAHTSAAKRILDAFAEEIADENPDALLYPLITERGLLRLKNSDVAKAGKPTRSQARPLPEKLFAIAKAILDEGETGPLGKSGKFHVNLNINGKIRRIYCPVIPTILRNAFDIPLRMVQWRRLDSGEGDVMRFNAEIGEWIKNEGALSGYWARRENRSLKDCPTRGYAHRFSDKEGGFTGILVNTNKTGKPYVLPWHHVDVLLRCGIVAQWQERYNPVAEPTKPENYIDNINQASQATLQELPEIFPLFRMPTSGSSTGRLVTPSELDHAWQFLMLLTEESYNQSSPDEPIKIVSRQVKTNQPQQSIYNMHGLRVRGLTDLYRSGVPLELLSKMVAGHATLMMTLYYVEFDPSHVNSLLDEAAREARARGQRELINGFKGWDLDQALRRTVALDNAAIESAVLSKSKIEYCNVDIGFCPWDCTRCDDGGPVIRQERLKSGLIKDKHGPVPGGPRNCVMCRHFVTGPEWIDQLQWYGSKLCAKRRRLAEKTRLINEKADYIKTLRTAKELSQELFRQSYDALQAELVPLLDELEPLENAIFNTECLLDACLRVLDTDIDGRGGRYIVASRDSVVEYIETTDFDGACMLAQAAYFYPVFDDEAIERVRNEHLNRVLFNAGMPPPDLMFGIAPDKLEKARYMFTKFLFERTTQAERSNLIKGTTQLQDLGVHQEVRKLISDAIGQPFKLTADAGPLAVVEVHQ